MREKRDHLGKTISHAVRALALTLRRGCAPTPPRPALPFRGRPRLDRDAAGNVWCTACGQCVDRCPTACIHIQQGDEPDFQADEERCMYCGVCAEICPEKAIVLERGTMP